jgi:subtilase family protein/proprotein convertase P-domain-containing protein
MKRKLRYSFALPALLLLVMGGLLITLSFRGASAQRGGVQQPGNTKPSGPMALSAQAQAQIAALLKAKESLTPAQRKMDSALLHGIKARRGEPMTARGEVTTSRSASAVMKKTDANGRMQVSIKGTVDKPFIMMIQKYGGEVTSASEKEGVVRAWVPWEAVEALADNPEVRSVKSAAIPTTHRQIAKVRVEDMIPTLPFKTNPSLRSGLQPNFNERAMNLTMKLNAAIARAGSLSAQTPQANTGIVVSEGDTAHGALAGRNFFGVNGAGVKVGVLSDSVDFLPQSIASGDLPPDVTVLPGQSGLGNGFAGEGTAMLEIVHDLAPGAKLFFATAFTSAESFADNIRALRAAGCDIIVDDVIYSNESPFHDNLIATAVEEVVTDGALYFSSAGNEGNFNDGTSSVWEGDFKNSRTTLPLLPGGTLHDFGEGVISNRVESSSPFVLSLWWSDPLGGSDNDYDLFIMDNTLSTVIDFSTAIQDGDDDPFEITFGAFGNERILIWKADSAKRRALSLNNFGGQLGIGTSGSTHGHNSVNGAFGVAAIDSFNANGGTFIGGPTSPVELFSSDGFRRVFYRSSGSPITPGNLLFSSNGGEVRKKPDLTAADGVSTSVPGFAPFFGTSAAAPHAAAIAALLKSAKPRATATRIRNVLTKTALDIEANRVDRDSGAGIIDAFGALLEIGASPSPLLDLGTVATTEAGGNGNGIVEPGESGSILASLANIGGATAVGISATLTTTTPGVTIGIATSNYPFIGSNGQSATNTVPFTFNVAPNVLCGQTINFTLTATYGNSPFGPQAFNFSIRAGQGPDLAISYTGPAVPIPDANPTGISIPLVVSGVNGPVNNLRFRFDGSSCSSAGGSTTVGLDHSWVGDLTVTLRSPQGTTVTLISRPTGGISFGNNDGNNFCNTVLDDSATELIQIVSRLNAPFTGTFKPANPLAAFNGEPANGTWMLTVSDSVNIDTGNVRAFSLVFSNSICSTGP